MKTLKVCFLWHQHQPYYNIDNEFVLPWVLFHSTKDYFDIPEVLYEFPSIKQTFNFAPSLNLQIAEYINFKANDKIRNLALIEADKLSDADKKAILHYYFICNYKNMIVPHKRYNELFERKSVENFKIDNFNNQDWLDLQVWYHLVWFGYFSSNRNIIKRLIDKGQNFTEHEKILLLNEQFEILNSITNQYRKLYELGQISLSCSPMYHPILPLIIDSKATLESLPFNNLPDPVFSYPDDANLQVKQGLEYFKETFGHEPIGMWPSEGSISNETLELLIKNNIKWVASDENVLSNSLDDYNNLDKYFPYKYKCNEGSINIFFRDHNLSDKIGFVYSNWNESDAANDFINNLKNIRNTLISNYGEQILDEAVVSIILDGENCWEYYKDNGIPFLRALFNLLQNDNEIETNLFDEIVKNGNIKREILNIKAGSWINANFSIWMGDKEDIKAWSLLAEARIHLENTKNSIDEKDFNNAMRAILIAEGSDWFWWYGPEHPTETKPIFDYIFRHYLRKVYEYTNSEYPIYLDKPIWEQLNTNNSNINLDKIEYIGEIFENTGKLLLNNENISSMHRSGEIIKSIKQINLKNKSYLEIDYDIPISNINSIELDIKIENNGNVHSNIYKLNNQE
ncbi:MAG TPA: glycoside hydrolase family 57 protein [Candidatus Kapabacteria bacterium]|nr:glycoside hydrolase family 57 protein [Candidatus Kapabacteria bacterium]